MGLFKRKPELTTKGYQGNIASLKAEKERLDFMREETQLKREIKRSEFEQSTAGQALGFGKKIFENLKARPVNLGRGQKSIFATKDDDNIYKKAKTESNLDHYTSGFNNPFILGKKKKP